jgi:hypothetical protein
MKRQSQKVPLNTDQDHITPSYLRALGAAVRLARVVRRRMEDANDSKGAKIAVTEDGSPTLVNRLKSASARIADIKNKIAQKEKEPERAKRRPKSG